MNYLTPIMYVCPVCDAGKSFCFSGTLVPRLCERCRADREAWMPLARCPHCGK